VALAALLAAAVVLIAVSGGFPPWAWRFLLHVLPEVSRLWGMQGAGVLLPLLGLLLLSLALLIMWVVIVLLALKIVVQGWRDSSARRCFALDLQEAERLAEMEVAERSFAYENAAADGPGQYQQAWLRAQAAATTQQYSPVIARASRAAGDSYVSRAPTAPAAAVPYVLPAAQQQVGRGTNVPGIQEPAARRLAVGDEQSSGSRSLRSASLHKRLRIVSSVEDELDSEEPAMEGLENAFAPFTRKQADVLQRGEPGNGNESEAIGSKMSTSGTQDVNAGERVLEQPDAVSGRNTNYDTLPDMGCLVQNAALRLLIGIGLDPGIVRKNVPNEDSLFAIQGLRITRTGSVPAGLFIVADGMGGHANGREASRMAIQAMSDVIVPSLLRDVSETNAQDEHNLFKDLSKDGVHRANLAIYRKNRERAEMMGTTVTAALIVDTTAYIVNVGDSRTYLYRPASGLKQVTRDHSVVAGMVAAGIITSDEIYTHPRRNEIERCLGERPSVETDFYIEALQAGDILLLCSDGLWEMVRDGAIEQIIASAARQPATISNLLVQAALGRGGADNISVVVVGVVGAEG